MKNNLRYVLWILLINFVSGSSYIYGQKKNFKPGIIHFKDGTLKEGFIEENIFFNLGHQVLFQENLNSEIEIFLPTQLNGFTFKETDISYVSIVFEYYEFIKKTNSFEKSSRGKRFGKVLVEGEVDLIKVPISKTELLGRAMGSKNHLYLIKKDDEYIQIDLLQILNSGGNKVVSKKYKGLLTYALNECDEIAKIAEKTEFTDKAIINIVSRYHDCVGSSDSFKIANEVHPAILTHRLRSGYIWLKDRNIDNDRGLTFGYQLEVLTPALSRNLGVSIAFEYISQSYDWDFFAYDGRFKESNLRVTIGLDIHFIQRDHIKLKLSPSFSSYLLLSQNPTVIPKSFRTNQLLALELFAELKRIGIFLRIGGHPGDVYRPNGLRNVGLSYLLN